MSANEWHDMDIGDFGLPSASLDFARDEQGKRSERSRKQDGDKRAPVTTDVQSWAESPDRYDYPGIDTPSENPGVLPKDLMNPAETQLTAQARGKEPAETMNISSDEAERSLLDSSDVSLSPNEAFEGSSSNQGQRRPSSLRLPEDAYQNLASGVDAEMNFIESEESRFDMGEELFGNGR